MAAHIPERLYQSLLPCAIFLAIWFEEDGSKKQSTDDQGVEKRPVAVGAGSLGFSDEGQHHQHSCPFPAGLQGPREFSRETAQLSEAGREAALH